MKYNYTNKLNKEANSMAKAILDIIKEPVFRVNDISDISYRQINDWEEKGLIKPVRKDAKKGWRNFSVIDLLSLKVIRDLKKHNIPNNYIEQVINYILANLQILQLNVITGNEDAFYLLYCDNDKITLIQGKNTIIAIFKEYSEKHKPVLIIPIGNYFLDTIKQYYKNLLSVNKDSTINPLINVPSNIKEEMIMDMIRDKNYTEILIQKKDKDYVIKSKEPEINKLSDKEILEIIKSNNFQTVEVKVHNGNIAITKQETEKI